MRESPLVEVVEAMIGKGFAVKIYDKYVSIARLMGANKEYIEKEIPHISSLMCGSARELVRGSDVIVVGNVGSDFREVLLSETTEGQVVIDLVRIFSEFGQRYGGNTTESAGDEAPFPRKGFPEFMKGDPMGDMERKTPPKRIGGGEVGGRSRTTRDTNTATACCLR